MPGEGSSRTALQVHFVNHHMRYIIVVLEDGNLPLPCFTQCDMFVSWEALSGRHLDVAIFVKGKEWNHGRWVGKEAYVSISMSFQAYR